MTIQDIVKILTDSGIESNEANIEVKMLIEHFANYGVKDIIMGKKLDEKKLALVKEKAILRAKQDSQSNILSDLQILWEKNLSLTHQS